MERPSVLYATTTFVGAFLLFQVEPIIARLILPWFGGSAAVWTTCLLFFQMVLLLGYLYANWLVNSLSSRKQARLHVAILVVSLLLLPITPGSGWKPTSSENPTLLILGLLSVSIGLPFFLLSTTSPLVQAWYARTTRGSAPYHLYSLSNFASLMALLTYPVVVEPFLSRRTQALLWSWTYVVFVLLCGASAWRSRGAEPGADEISIPSSTGEVPNNAEQALTANWSLRGLWIMLAACPSILLLAMTSFLSQDVAAIPFLWIMPLSLYLLSFVLCFSSGQWYRRAVFLPLLPPALAAMTYRIPSQNDWGGLPATLLIFDIGFFVCCMVCHGELIRLRPSLRHLTTFYLMISIGGALGGVFVGLVAPYVFVGNFELPIGLVLCAFLALMVLYRDSGSRFFQARPRTLWILFVCGWLVLAGFQIKIVRGWISGSRVMVRNFYGRLWVGDSGTPDDEDAYRKLRNGVITHGEQWLSPKKRREPTTYYCGYSGIGLAFQELQQHSPLKVGVIGLGAGTLATYGRAGDVFRFYEINPLVIHLAKTQFTFLKDSPARIDIVPGDARLSLEDEPSQNFDLLAVDAFTSDSIPIHLLTEEAIALYFHHLRPDGVLALHISNRYLDLAPVVQLASQHFHQTARLIDTDDDDDNNCFGSKWVLLTNRPAFFDDPDVQKVATSLTPKPRLRLWTDDYSNLYQILK
jgi:SAM-dependent methyltransferase